MSTQDNHGFGPSRVGGNLFVDEIFQVLGQFGHKFRTWGDSIGIKWVVFGNFQPLQNSLFQIFFCFVRGPKSSGTLLVHLGTGSHSINCHIEHTFWFYDFEKMLNIREDSGVHLVIRHPTKGVIIRMSARVENGVHVQI